MIDDPFIIKVNAGERNLLRVYRFCRFHYEFFIGFILGVIVTILVKR